MFFCPLKCLRGWGGGQSLIWTCSLKSKFFLIDALPYRPQILWILQLTTQLIPIIRICVRFYLCRSLSVWFVYKKMNIFSLAIVLCDTREIERQRVHSPYPHIPHMLAQACVKRLAFKHARKYEKNKHSTHIFK